MRWELHHPEKWSSLLWISQCFWSFQCCWTSLGWSALRKFIFGLDVLVDLINSQTPILNFTILMISFLHQSWWSSPNKLSRYLKGAPLSTNHVGQRHLTSQCSWPWPATELQTNEYFTSFWESKTENRHNRLNFLNLKSILPWYMLSLSPPSNRRPPPHLQEKFPFFP